VVSCRYGVSAMKSIGLASQSPIEDGFSTSPTSKPTPAISLTTVVSVPEYVFPSL
jgi:hypothetical protein